MALLPGNVGIMVLVLLVPGLLWLGKKRRNSRRPWAWFLLFLCCACGWLRMSGYQQEGAEKEVLRLTEGKRVWVRGTVEEIEEKEKSYGVRLSDCQVMSWKKGKVGESDAGSRPYGAEYVPGYAPEYVPEYAPGYALEYKIPDMIVYVEREAFEREDKMQTIRLGMEAACFGELEEPSEARNPGEFDFREYYRALGIRMQMFGEDVKILDTGRCWRYRDLLYRMRMAAGEVLAGICEPEDLGIFQAAILGDKTALDDGVRKLYQRNGIAHLLAISGLHISLVGMFVYQMLRKSGMGYGVAGVIGTVVIVSYGVLTGGSSSVMRAVMMILIFLLAGYLGRSYDMLSAAGMACIMILMEYPGLVTQAGFQLSFGAVAAIGGLGPWMVEKLEVKSGFGKTIALGAAVQMVTCPVIVYHFYQYPVYGILLNLAVIPLMGYVVVSGILGIALGAVWRPAGVMAIGSGHYILEFYRWLCMQVEKLPGANLVIGRPELWQIGVYGAGMAAMLWFVCRRMSGKKAVYRSCILAAGSVLCFLILLQLPVKGMEVTFLDVGQGDGICIRTKDVVILVDGGSTDKKNLGENTMEPYFKSHGITDIDYAVVSHGDKDHISGLQYLLEENGDIHIQNLILPWLGKEDPSYEPLAHLMEARGGQIHWMQAGERIKAGDLSMTCLYHGSEARKQERNEHSLVLELNYGTTAMLLTGDMSEAGELDMISSQALKPDGHPIQILKAAHHGSQYSSCTKFLKLVNPQWVIMSCGEGNSYGHPHEETLKRYREQGIKMLITEDTGAVIMSMDGEKMIVSTYLNMERVQS